jgi:8-oxo-dGTP pyrophosphatase MutT (NUDIX family)
MGYIDQIKKYEPKNEQEMLDKKAMLSFIKLNDDHLLRSNLVGHLTSSAIVVNEAMNKVLFCYHNIYKSWSWVGGHVDGNPDFLDVAIKEAKEETGVKNIKACTSDIFMIDNIYVHNHIKHGEYVPDHIHLNVTYLLIANEQDQLTHKPDENQGVRWFDIEDVLNHVSEERMKKVYIKAFKYMKNLNCMI